QVVQSLMGRLLILGYVWPEPRSSAAGGRIMQLIECFQARGWDITFASAARRSDQCADLALYQVRETEVALNCSSFDEFVVGLQPDLVMFDRFVPEEQFGWRVAEACPSALRILDTADLHSLRWTRQQLLKESQKACSRVSEQNAFGPVVASREQLFQTMASS